MTSTDGPRGHPVVAEADRLVGHLDAPVVAVLVDGRERPAVGALAAWRPRGRVVRCDVREPSPRLHVQLAAAGPFDLVVDLVPRGSRHRMEGLTGHLRAGGAWVARTPDGVEVRRSGDALLAVVRDAELVDVLALDPSRGRVLDRLEGERWQVRSRVRTSGAVEVNPMPDHYDAPDLYLREYADVVVLPRQVVVQRGLVLPESFTTVEDHRQRNAALHNVGLDFVRSPLTGPERAEPTALAGRWFHLDNHLLWHFGHAVTEQLSHLWGWHRARAADPGLRALVCSETGELTAWQRDLLAAGGVPPDEVHVARAAVRVETLVGCTPMYSRPAFVHPRMLETYQQVSGSLSPRAGAGPWPRRVFLGRRSTKRACRNADELAAEFTAAGFEVVHPEDLPLADQVELVRRAEVVAGFAGSAMFHVAFTGGPRHVVLVTSESYPAHNEYLMSALLGHRLDVVLCEPEVPRVDGRFTRESFHSDFSYRPEREGVFLRSVLAEG